MATEPADAEMAPAADADAGESDSGSGSDFEEVDVSEEDVRSLEELEKAVEANPNLYDQHVQYITLLRKCKMRARLAEARHAMHARFPLAEPLWLEWLRDERGAAPSPADTQALEALFDLAVQDYLSISIWLEYLQFLATDVEAVRSGSAAGKEQFRAVAERALAAGGLHVSEGSRLWQAFREYEQQHAAQEPSDPDHPATKLLLRQLQVPLADGAESLEAWRQLGGGEPPATAGKALALAQARRASEASVAADTSADADLLAAYMAYIKLEEASGEPARAVCLYERALARFPVTHALWQQYCQFLEQHLNLPGVVGPAYTRATRNCPWVGALWARGLRALERSGAPEERQQALFDAALAAGLEAPEDYLEVSLARADAVRRRGRPAAAQLRQLFQATHELMQTYFPDHVDRSLRLPAYWAQCELEVGGDYAAGREVWEAALRTPLGSHADAVAAYVAFETGAKHFDKARSIFRQYHARSLADGGGPALCEAWLRFERERGSADDLFRAVLKTEPVLLRAQAAAAAAAGEAAAAQAAADAQADKRAKAPLSREEARQLRQQKDPNFRKAQGAAGGGGKRRKGLGSEGDAAEGQAKRQKTAQQQQSPAEEASSSAAAQPAAAQAGAPGSGGSKAMGPPPPRSMGPPPPRQPQAGADAASEGGQAGAPAAGGSHRKAYIKGLAAEASKAELEAVLAPCGALVDLSLPEARGPAGGRHRGFAYATFGSPQGLQAALALDGSELRGQRLSIAVAHQEVAPDARTAFVLNVAPGTQQEALQALLASCGAIASLRLPLERESGQPRGFAYVEFETREALQRAVDMTGCELDGRNLKISVAAPPGGGGGGGGGGRGRGRGPPRGGGGGRGARGGRGPPGGRGGRGGRGGGGGGGLENGGRGGPDGRGGARAGRQQLDVGGGGGFRPRAVGGNAVPPRSNADFRALLGGKKE